jgi:hypothetical protein
MLDVARDRPGSEEPERRRFGQDLLEGGRISPGRRLRRGRPGG